MRSVRGSKGVFLVALMAAGPLWAEGEISPAELGRQLVVRFGCPGCHEAASPAFTGLRRVGPDLRRLAAKTTPAWTFRWVTAPRELRPSTWMPHFFDDGDPAEVRAIVAYLLASSDRVEYPPPPAGDAASGEALFNSVGCTGCHRREAAAGRLGEPYRLHGPNLIHLGSKVNAAWLFAWLKDPRQYAPETAMPRLRLSDREAADLTAFLMASRAPEDEAGALPPATAEDVKAGQEAVALYGCYGCHLIAGFENAEKHAGILSSAAGFSGHGVSGLPDFGLSAREVEAIRTAMASAGEAAAAIVEGRKLVAQYNCRGCHLVEGRGGAVEATLGPDRGLLPPSLQSEGSRVQPEWLAAFLADPGRVVLRPWLTVRMPTFSFSAAEIHAAVAYFAALEAEQLALAPAAPPAARSVALGRETFQLLECARCHPSGAAAAQALGVAAADLAPSLEIARRRLRYAWMPRWIKDPQSWLPGTRMPTFFFAARTGGFSTPFAAALDAPALAEPKARLRQHFATEAELEAFLCDAEAVIAAMRDYVWSLGEGQTGGGDVVRDLR